ncbi:Condensin complex subunit [Boothiomyces macroporosus]|uniref:Condensin complex subunit n=1 Tax=Boothiomyces macroporosus TaxID=261099 RepID=A0AAD5Y8C1_9FUNG|nr:Condensin complex subunit [Boothiomyces macroporosus]
MDDFLKEERLSEYLSEILSNAINTFQLSAMTERVLKMVSDKQYSEKQDQDGKTDVKLPKAISKFLIHYSELQPKDIFKNFVHLQGLLDSESYNIRSSLIEVIGNIIHNYLVKDDSPSSATNLTNFYDILKQRFLDTNQFVRLRVLNTLIKLTQRHEDTPSMTDIPISIRQSIVELTVLRVKDKNSFVRKKAIELLSAFMETSPFIAVEQDMGSLSLKKFEKLHANLLEIIKARLPPDVQSEESDDIVENPNKESEAPPSFENPFTDNSTTENIEIKQLQSFVNYYSDGIKFAQLMNESCSTIAELLSSSTKSEVIAAMKFISVAYRYEIDTAEGAVKRMIHNIWDKDVNDKETGSVRETLINCFSNIYMEPPESNIPEEQVVLENLLHLVDCMDLAQLTSLEELLSIMSETDKIPEHLPNSLWKSFSTVENDVKARRNALIILGMIGKSNSCKDIIADKLDILTKYGLHNGHSSNYEIPKYSCIALLQLYAIKRQRGSLAASRERMPMDHPTCERIVALILSLTNSKNWFSFAEQGINALYTISEHPDKLCAGIISELSNRVFAVQPPEDPVDEISKKMEESLNLNQNKSLKVTDTMKLSQLIFVVGHVAIRQIVHLENIESEWKRRRMQKSDTNKQANEMDMVTGTAEDEFQECVSYVRERELLFGVKSLLAKFGPLIVRICTHNLKYKDFMLQTVASISLSKFMCVSSEFCETHLQLLFTILERSKNPTIRSNIIIGLGDLAICFNSLIDQNIIYLYNRLKDTDFHTKKNALMVLTFLILNGMIKVKGQISEMAKCTQDPDERIKGLAKLFFKELATKDNAIYNNLPDIISNLSTTDEDQYKSIIKFLFAFIIKDKKVDGTAEKSKIGIKTVGERQNEIIADKLCLRFKHASTERQWRDIGFCLTLLNYGNEKSFKKLIEHLPLYKDKLYEETLYKYLLEIINKTGKNLQKVDFKPLIEDFRETLVKCHDKAIEDHEAGLEASKQAEKTKPKIEKVADVDDLFEADNIDSASEEDISKFVDIKNNEPEMPSVPPRVDISTLKLESPPTKRKAASMSNNRIVESDEEIENHMEVDESRSVHMDYNYGKDAMQNDAIFSNTEEIANLGGNLEDDEDDALMHDDNETLNSRDSPMLEINPPSSPESHQKEIEKVQEPAKLKALKPISAKTTKTSSLTKTVPSAPRTSSLSSRTLKTASDQLKETKSGSTRLSKLGTPSALSKIEKDTVKKPLATKTSPEIERKPLSSSTRNTKIDAKPARVVKALDVKEAPTSKPDTKISSRIASRKAEETIIPVSKAPTSRLSSKPTISSSRLSLASKADKPEPKVNVKAEVKPAIKSSLPKKSSTNDLKSKLVKPGLKSSSGVAKPKVIKENKDVEAKVTVQPIVEDYLELPADIHQTPVAPSMKISVNTPTHTDSDATENSEDELITGVQKMRIQPAKIQTPVVEEDESEDELVSGKMSVKKSIKSRIARPSELFVSGRDELLDQDEDELTAAPVLKSVKPSLLKKPSRPKQSFGLTSEPDDLTATPKVVSRLARPKFK